METPVRGLRIEDELLEAAKKADPALENAGITTLVRVALAALASGALAASIGDLVRQYGNRPPAHKT
jgi:hypothetical protein